MEINFGLLRATQRLSGGLGVFAGDPATVLARNDELGRRFGIQHTRHLRNLYVYFWRWAT